MAQINTQEDFADPSIFISSEYLHVVGLTVLQRTTTFKKIEFQNVHEMYGLCFGE